MMDKQFTWIFLSTLLCLGGFFVTNIYAQEAVGRVIAAHGLSSATNSSNQTRHLKRRSRIYVGDKIETGAKSRVQIRYQDNSLITTRPDSTYVVQQFRYNSKTHQKNNSTLNLITGSIRFITGKMSKKNPNAFKIKTPVALVGIRGSVGTVATTQKVTDITMDQGVADGTTNVGNKRVVVGEGHRYANAQLKNNVAKTSTYAAQSTFDSIDTVSDMSFVRLLPGEPTASEDQLGLYDFEEDTRDLLGVNTTGGFFEIFGGGLNQFPLLAAFSHSGVAYGARALALSTDPGFGVNAATFLGGISAVPPENASVDSLLIRNESGSLAGLPTTVAPFAGLGPGVTPGSSQVFWGYWNNTTNPSLVNIANLTEQAVTGSPLNYWVVGVPTPVGNLPAGNINYQGIMAAGVDESGASITGATLTMTLNFTLGIVDAADFLPINDALGGEFRFDDVIVGLNFITGAGFKATLGGEYRFPTHPIPAPVPMTGTTTGFVSGNNADVLSGVLAAAGGAKTLDMVYQLARV